MSEEGHENHSLSLATQLKETGYFKRVSQLTVSRSALTHFVTLLVRIVYIQQTKRKTLDPLTYFRKTGHKKPYGDDIRRLNITPFPLYYLITSSSVMGLSVLGGCG